ncbi:DUF6173 family protein [Maritimibacter alkaliphilus]|uniref:DUF6173 family protein n=1 Tax=Maritimibacter alkaliphilus TaxID=404236 RepID=UPI001C97B3AA|nr:DUF6173 family protein [Maritimibacter alkaliphilus]MBY6092428.1 hypothetical protein [Maritimibacter alkaliphilus]
MGEDIRTVAEAAEEHCPRRHEAHADPALAPAVELPAQVTSKPQRAKSPAEWAYERLILYIQNFESTLDAEHEVAMGFAGSDAGVLRIEGMGFFEPDIVTFYGSDAGGAKTQLIQHVSQLSVILRAMPKAQPAVAPRRIGFRLAADLEQEAEKDAPEVSQDGQE